VLVDTFSAFIAEDIGLGSCNSVQQVR
jgi:hypothetical protein